MDLYFHVYNRAVYGTKLYSDNSDYRRFLQGLYFFNSPARCALKTIPDRWNPKWWKRHHRTGPPLVSILSYITLPDQCHLFLRAKTKQQFTKFIQKLMVGYTMFIQAKYKKRDRVFASRTKFKIVTSENHYFHLPNYIHLNCLDLVNRDWREGKLDWHEVEQFAGSYKWSSLPHYIGKYEDPILDNDWIKKRYPDRERYLTSLKRWTERDLPRLHLGAEMQPR